MLNIKHGTKLGAWNVTKQIGQGGNGRVWHCKRQDGVEGAIKLLRYPTAQTANKRLKHEVDAMKACQGIPGVLPLLDAHLPLAVDPNDPAWFVSAHARPLDDAFEQPPSLAQSIELIASLARTLGAMHAINHSHRDIKPGNIFRHAGTWCIGDFGLADFPGKEAMTKKGEKLGPAFYIAPEMLNEAEKADGKAADVYSLGKLMWRVAVGQTYPLPGTHLRNEPAMTITAYVANENTLPLDGLLQAMTQLSPLQRPTMATVVAELEAWLTPPPEATAKTDLSKFASTSASLLSAYRQEQATRQARRLEAEEHWGRAFKRLAATMAQLKSELEKIGDTWITSLKDCSDFDFYRAATNDELIGRDHRRIWTHQFQVLTKLDAGNRRASLKCGVNLGLPNVVGDPDTLEDIYAPTLAAAGYIIDTEKLVSESWKVDRKLAWSDHGQFSLGQPSEHVMMKRLEAGLLEHLAPSVEQFLSAFQALET